MLFKDFCFACFWFFASYPLLYFTAAGLQLLYYLILETSTIGHNQQFLSQVNPAQSFFLLKGYDWSGHFSDKTIQVVDFHDGFFF